MTDGCSWVVKFIIKIGKIVIYKKYTAKCETSKLQMSQNAYVVCRGKQASGRAGNCRRNGVYSSKHVWQANKHEPTSQTSMTNLQD